MCPKLKGEEHVRYLSSLQVHEWMEVQVLGRLAAANLSGSLGMSHDEVAAEAEKYVAAHLERQARREKS